MLAIRCDVLRRKHGNLRMEMKWRDEVNFVSRDLFLLSIPCFVRIQEFSGSYPSSEIGYPAWGISWFSSGECWYITLNQATAVSFCILSNLLFNEHPGEVLGSHGDGC
jgi:hypothetical protein